MQRPAEHLPDSALAHTKSQEPVVEPYFTLNQSGDAWWDEYFITYEQGFKSQFVDQIDEWVRFYTQERLNDWQKYLLVEVFKQNEDGSFTIEKVRWIHS